MRLLPLWLVGCALLTIAIASTARAEKIETCEAFLPGSRPYVAVIASFDGEWVTNANAQAVKDGVELYVRTSSKLTQLNLGFRYFSDGGDEHRARQCTEHLLRDENAVAIIGTIDSHSTRAIAETERASSTATVSPTPALALLTPGATHKFLASAPSKLATDKACISDPADLSAEAEPDWFFRVCLSDEQMIDGLVRYIGLESPGRVVRKLFAIHSGTYYGRGLRHLLKVKCERNEKAICSVANDELCVEARIDGDSDGSGKEAKRRKILDEFKAAWRKSGDLNDAIVLLLYTEDAAWFLDKIHAEFPTARVFVGTNNSRDNFRRQAGASATEGVVTVSSYGEYAAVSIERIEFEHQFPKDKIPDTYAAQGYDSAMFVVEAYARLPRAVQEQPPDRRAQLIGALNNLGADPNIRGVLGPFRFGLDRARELAPEIMVWSDGKLVPPKLAAKGFGLSPERSGMLLGLVGGLALVLLSWIPVKQFVTDAVSSVSIAVSSVSIVADRLGVVVKMPLGMPEVRFGVSVFHACAVFLLVLISAAAVLVLAGETRSPYLASWPVRLVMPSLLRVGWLRAKYYKRLLRRARKNLSQQRKAHEGERYIALPAAMTWHDLDSSLASTPVSFPNPADRLADVLYPLPARRGLRVLIRAPGGRGKSALLREVRSRLLDRVRIGGRIPLECELGALADLGGSHSFVQRLDARFAHEAQLIRDLRSGQFVLFLDRLSGSDEEIRQLVAVMNAEELALTHIVFGSRPFDLAQQSLLPDELFDVVCVPERLNDDGLDAFVKTYSNTKDVAREAITRTCKAPDGTYVPLLVRLALLAGPEATLVQTSDVYREALRRLLKDQHSPNEIIDQIAKLCAESTIPHRDGTLSYAEAHTQDKELLGVLKHAGILLPVEPHRLDRDTPEPRALRFLHENVHAYLTARGIAIRKDWQRLDSFVAHRRLTDAVATFDEADVYSLCIQLVSDRDQGALIDSMKTKLKAWARDYREVLSLQDVYSGLDDKLDAVQSALGSNEGAGRAIVVALGCFQKDKDARTELRLVSRLYRSVARKIELAGGDDCAVDSVTRSSHPAAAPNSAASATMTGEM